MDILTPRVTDMMDGTYRPKGGPSSASPIYSEGRNPLIRGASGTSVSRG